MNARSTVPPAFASIRSLSQPQERRDGSLASLRRASAAVGVTPIRHEGRVETAGIGEAEVLGLPEAIAAGTCCVVHTTSASGMRTVAAVVKRASRERVTVEIDAPVRPGDRVVPVATFSGADPSWLGRTLDAHGRPLDEQPTPLASLRPPREGGSRHALDPVVTGVGAIDCVAPVLSGETWHVVGPRGTGRTTLLRMIGEEGFWDAVVHCVIGYRAREREALAEPRENRVTILASRGCGPAEAATAVELAAAIAADLDAQGLRTVLLIDGAPCRVRTGAGVTGFVVPAESVGLGAPDGILVLDPAIAGSGMFPALDLAATLASVPSIDRDPSLRVLAERDDPVARNAVKLLREQLRQSPRDGREETDPGLGVVRGTIADLVRAAEDEAKADDAP